MRKNCLLIFFMLGLCMMSGCGYPISQELPDDIIPAITEKNTEVVTKALESDNAIVCSKAPDGVTIITNDNFEVYEKLTVRELVVESNVEIKNYDEFIDTGKTGKLNANISYIYNNKLYKQSVSYSVVDTTEPVLLNSGEYSILQRGTAFDLNEYVGFADNYDSNPKLTYEGFVDTSLCGIYPITAQVSDSSGNNISWDLNIEVVDEIPEPEDNNTRIAFDEFTQKYSGENASFGIDVSRWQGDINFEAVKNAGCSFVIMRIGHYYDEIEIDEYYKANMEAAKKAGLDIGVYVYTTANTKEEICENAEWIANQLNGQQLDFPVVFDWEDFSNFQQYEMSIHDLNELFELFASEMRKYGYSSMLYSSKNFLNNFWYENTEYPVWLAHYTDQTDYLGEYVMWQASCFGQIDGINGDVDLNILWH